MALIIYAPVWGRGEKKWPTASRYSLKRYQPWTWQPLSIIPTHRDEPGNTTILKTTLKLGANFKTQVMYDVERHPPRAGFAWRQQFSPSATDAFALTSHGPARTDPPGPTVLLPSERHVSWNLRGWVQWHIRRHSVLASRGHQPCPEKLSPTPKRAGCCSSYRHRRPARALKSGNQGKKGCQAHKREILVQVCVTSDKCKLTADGWGGCW